MNRAASERAIYRAGYLAVSVAVLFLDQWSKGAITRHLAVHESREIWGDFFSLSYVRNTGAAFGLFASVD